MEDDLKLLTTISKDMNDSVTHDLWIAIRKMFSDDGMNYTSELPNIKIITSTNGDSLMTHKGRPYCVWSSPKIEMGLTDDLNTSIRCEILLKRI